MAFDVNRRHFLGTALAAGALASTSRLVGAAPPLKVAFLYPSPVGDFGWSYRHEIGRKDVVAEFGDAVATSWLENVAEGPDAERALTRFARSGNGLIFGCSFGYMEQMLKVAKDFSDVKFEHNTGYKTANNVSVYNARFHEGRSVFGAIAARMSKTGIIGYVGSFPIPEVIMGINAFTLAARKARPDIQVRVVWVNKWFDPGQEADAAKALIAQGADIITQHTNSTSPTQIAEEAGVYSFGQDADMSAFGPRAHLTGIVNNWGPYYVRRVRDVIEGRWQSVSAWDGLAEGVVQLAPYNKALPTEVVAAAEETRNGIAKGTLHPFEGPIVDQAGTTVLPTGQKLPDKDIHAMNWFVEGVIGDLPK